MVSGTWQTPATHITPAAQIAPAPHLQTPAAQPSARAPQSVQVPPAGPHADTAVPALQVLPLQQPVAQLVASHTHVPAEQR